MSSTKGANALVEAAEKSEITRKSAVKKRYPNFLPEDDVPSPTIIRTDMNRNRSPSASISGNQSNREAPAAITNNQLRGANQGLRKIPLKFETFQKELSQ